jgi:tetratricopeptide (TPR) repeat protein
VFDKFLDMLCGAGSDGPSDLNGQHVLFARPDVVLRVTPDDEAATLDPGDGVFRVEGERDGWLWLATGGVEGWARRDGVVPFEQACDHFAAGLNRGGDERFAVQQLSRIQQAIRRRALAMVERLSADLPPELAGVVAQLREQAGGLGQCGTGLKSLEHFYAGLDLQDDPAAAERAYTEAIALQPTHEAFNNRGLARHTLKDYAGAVADFTEALRLVPEDATVYCNRGRTHKFMGALDQARADYDAAIRLDRYYAPAYYNRGLLHKARRDYAAALADYGRAARIDREYANAFNNRAWLWATCPDAAYRDGRRAVRAARRACRLTGGKEVGFLDTLAASYAEAGDFARAVKWQRKVLAAREAAGDAKEAEATRGRLALYEADTPYRFA